MNAFVQSDTLTVALADLNAPARVAEIDIFVLRHEASTPSNRPAWLYAVAQGTGQRVHFLVDRKSVVKGKSVSDRVVLGGRGTSKKTNVSTASSITTYINYITELYT